jgi:hypothetical protein
MDPIVAYERFGKNAHIFERALSEDFGAWARRRVEEMRRVKEDRIRGSTTRAWGKHVGKGYMCEEYSCPTTQPTTVFDIDAHDSLDFLLYEYTLTDPYVPSYRWFTEYAWRWHRNFSGCWVLGYDNQCQGGTVPCTCCNVGSGSMYWPCFCTEFNLDAPAPEEVQRCSLVEWVKGKLRVVMEEEEDMEGRENDLDGGWDVVSCGTSLDWEVLSGSGEREI